MVWPFRKSNAEPPNESPRKLYYKSGPAFFESQCQFGHTSIEKGVALVALVIDAQKELGTPTPISIGKDGTQFAALKVASSDGGFLTFAETPSDKGDPLQPDDLVLWVPSLYNDEVGRNMSDRRSGWIGLILAKIKAETEPNNQSFVIACL